MNDNKETENVCNMPEEATIVLHQSNDTGLYYVEVINHGDHIKSKKGYWETAIIGEKKVSEIAKIISGVLRGR